jgi:hypothetical protein
LNWLREALPRKLNASMAAPLAPAVSPFGITQMGMPACSSRWAHGSADLFDKPILKLPCRFQCASAHDECVGVEGVHHLSKNRRSMGLR